MENSIWGVIITMTTVGYGDIFPKSGVGRFIGVIVALWGLFLVSIFTVTLTNLFSSTLGEQKAFDLSARLKQKDELKSKAVDLLASSYRSIKARKKGDVNKIKVT
jgi:voltage-gated potassium channel